jgi:hypothetical protein
MDSQDRVNANYLNGVVGDLPCPRMGEPVVGQCHFEQRALKFVYGGYKLVTTPDGTYLVAGETEPRNIGSYVPQQPFAGPSHVRVIRVFEQSIQAASPTNNSETVPEQPLDSEAIRHNLGHEVGHALGLFDVHTTACSPVPTTVMVSGYLNQTILASDCHWAHIPHGYAPQEKTAVRLRWW